MITTIVLLTIGSVFTVYEVVAHFVFHNTTIKTASSEIRSFEGKSLIRKLAVTALILLLWLHLVIELF